LESGPGYVDDRIFRRFLLEYFTLCDPEPDCVVTFQNYDFPSYRPYHAGLLLGGENRRMIMFDQLGPGYPFRIANTWRYCCSGNIEYGGFYKPKDPELIRPGKQQKLF
jgi:hypothetical protein